MCFLEVVNCHSKDRPHGPTGCLARCVWATVDTRVKEIGSAAEKSLILKMTWKSAWVWGMPVEQAWSPSVLAFCDTEVGRVKPQ